MALRTAHRATLLAGSGAVLVLIGARLQITWILGSTDIRAVTTFTDLALTLGALLASAACTWAGLRHHGRTRFGWLLIGAGMGSWTLGQAAWCWYEVVLGGAIPFPGLPDAGYLVAYPLVLAGILAFRAPGDALGTRLGTALSSVIVSVAALMTLWHFTIQPVLDAGAQTTFARLLGAAYPVGDALIASMAITLAIRASQASRRALVALALGMVTLGAADSVFAVSTAEGVYQSGRVIAGQLWMLAFLVIACGGVLAAWRPERRETPAALRGVAQLALLYVPVPVAIGVVVLERLGEGKVTTPVFIGLLVLITLILARQAMTARDSSRSMGRLDHLAHHDALTGMANGRLFDSFVERALARPASNLTALLYIDLDDFKSVNDRAGHEAGDQLLTDAAVVINAAIRPEDESGRIGGDEFAVLCTGLGARAEAVIVADRIIKALATCGSPLGRGVEASIGVSIERCRSVDATELMRRGDVAMYRAKQYGKGQVALYEASMDDGVQQPERRKDLERAVAEHQFRLHYQPIVSARTRAVVGFEALLRWQHPRRGLLAPEDFLADLEETGLIVPLGEWILKESCRQVAQWRKETGLDLDVSVNLSHREVRRSRLVEIVADALTTSGLPGSSLIIELTESGLIIDTVVTAAHLGEIRQLGVRVALDDFGTGYSPMAYLLAFPVNLIKIDKSFVDGVPSDGISAPFAAALVQLGGTLHVHTIAEGVESEPQAGALEAMGCDLLQGYLLSRPMTPAAARLYLDAFGPPLDLLGRRKAIRLPA
jgi:diguanylate cyclase (GGDEF)-like protein